MEQEKDALAKQLDGVDMVFLLAGLGGGTGGGATPEVARVARDAGALVFAFCPMPFSWEKGRHAQAEDAMAELRKHANAVIPLPNDSLLQVGGPVPPPSNVLPKLAAMSIVNFMRSVRSSFVVG